MGTSPYTKPTHVLFLINRVHGMGSRYSLFNVQCTQLFFQFNAQGAQVQRDSQSQVHGHAPRRILEPEL